MPVSRLGDRGGRGVSALVRPKGEVRTHRPDCTTFFGLVGAATAAAMYARYVRPWQLTWGATCGEVSRAMPGDEPVKRPTFNATRAITIAAPPDEIWPWLVQVGLTRAGWYS